MLNPKCYIEIILKQKNLNYVKEYKFLKTRRFRFDYAIIDKQIAIEYEGIMSKKARHTAIIGYTNDCTKYNLAQINGWLVLRYTTLNYTNIENDINELILSKKL